MGYTAVHMKLMPSSPDADLQVISKKAEEAINQFHKTLVKIEEEPIAFGLKAIHLYFSWNDEVDTEKLEPKLAEIENVSSVELVDIRKAFG